MSKFKKLVEKQSVLALNSQGRVLKYAERGYQDIAFRAALANLANAGFMNAEKAVEAVKELDPDFAAWRAARASGYMNAVARNNQASNGVARNRTWPRLVDASGELSGGTVYDEDLQAAAQEIAKRAKKLAAD